ncbi:uncharacterized protein LOC135211534 [Macrobrachium nipponense]|uniref:uncharacterized protein LOC135211534 n=1 Tax=Macrobrachium nipponense TaxID=159736 RepID=UPI0030C7F1F8
MQRGNHSVSFLGPFTRERGLKILERILDERLRVIVKVGKQQYGFMRGRGMVDAIFIVRDVLSEEIRNEELWELLYGDDLVITAENEEDQQRRVRGWQESLERGGLKVSVNKTRGFAEH